MRKLFVLSFFVTLISSCRKEKPSEVPSSKGVYIVNEGNFNFGNGEISFYDPSTNQVSNNLFHSANNYSLGDVVQSMYVKDSIGLIVVNNSQKIQVVKIPSFENVRTIAIPNSSPRYILPINDSIAYVSELYANKIHVINFQTGILITQISVPQYTERLLKLDEYVFAEGKRIYSNPASKGALMRINTSNHAFIDKVEFNGDAGGIVKDKDNHIWIAVDEDTILSANASLKCFDKNFNLLTNSYLSPGQHPHNLCVDSEGEDIFFVSGNVYMCQNITIAVTPALFISRENRIFYTMAIDPANNDVYLSNALDYVQSSVIYRFDRNAQLIHSFTAGVITGDFAFNHE